MTCTTATSSVANNSTLAKRSVADLLNYRNRPTDTQYAAEITVIPKIADKHRAEGKLCPQFCAFRGVGCRAGLRLVGPASKAYHVGTIRAYEEIADFIAAGTTPQTVAHFAPSQETKDRVADLSHREKTTGLDPDEASELDQYLRMEHMMRLAKARARSHFADE